MLSGRNGSVSISQTASKCSMPHDLGSVRHSQQRGFAVTLMAPFHYIRSGADQRRRQSVILPPIHQGNDLGVMAEARMMAISRSFPAN